MARCRGTTKADQRCKRDAGEESQYCPMHEDQAEASGEPDAEDRDGGRRDDLLLIGVVAVGFMILRRLLRLV